MTASEAEQILFALGIGLLEWHPLQAGSKYNNARQKSRHYNEQHEVVDSTLWQVGCYYYHVREETPSRKGKPSRWFAWHEQWPRDDSAYYTSCAPGAFKDADEACRACNNHRRTGMWRSDQRL